MAAMTQTTTFDRRHFLNAGAATAAGLLALGSTAAAAEWTEAERANVKVVNDMCAAWVAPLDLDRIGRFLAEDAVFRMTETAQPIKGRQAIVEALRKTLGAASTVSFEVVQSFARGPMVINERIDRFTLPNRSINWNGVGVFFLKNGLIQEWLDFTVKMG